MTTILIGDIHLMATLILPLIDEEIKDIEVNQIIFTGDYCDQWSQQHNVNLFLDDLRFLIDWKEQKEAKGIKVTCLLGNHDLPYIVDRPAHYSLLYEDARKKVGDLLVCLQPQISCWVGEYLISHGGYLGDVEIDPMEQTQITYMTLGDKEFIRHLRIILCEVGECRGGQALYGGPVWADVLAESPFYPSKFYPKQVVGHRPLPEIETFTQKKNQMIGIDTFTISRTEYFPFFRPVATKPSVLKIVDGDVSNITISAWTEDEVGKAIYDHFTKDQD